VKPIDPPVPQSVGPLAPAHAAALDRDGYLLLRGAVPASYRDDLRAAFDAGVMPNDQWTAPRGIGWRHALVDLDPAVQRACRVPDLLAAAGRILGGPFFLSQVEGREPLPDHGHQPLHRDGAGSRGAAALIFLDPYGPANGGTRVVPRPRDDGEPDESLALVLEGQAGDIVVFDMDVLHGATLNRSGARRRSLLLGFLPESDRAVVEACRAVRDVRMAYGDSFTP